MNISTLISTFCILIAVLLSGCGSLQTKVRNEEAISQVKKVAVIAFKASLPASQTIGFNLNSGKAQGSAGGSMITQTSKETDQMLLDFQNSLSQTQKWTVVDLNTMKASAAYQKAYDSTMKGWQNKMPPPSGTNTYLVEGVMDSDGPRILGPEGRDALITSLNVDAIAMVYISTHFNGTTVMGIGSRRPQANVNMQIFKKGIEKAVWFETFEGLESSESVGKTGFIDEKKLAELSLKSAQSAYSKMGLTTQK